MLPGDIHQKRDVCYSLRNCHTLTQYHPFWGLWGFRALHCRLAPQCATGSLSCTHHVSHVRVLKFRVPGNKGNHLS